VRFIMVEAEMADSGDLSQITQAIQNALRPPATPIRLASPGQVKANGAAAASQAQPVFELEGHEVPEQEDDGEGEDAGRAAAQRTPRKPRTPKVLEIDLTTDPAFAAFAAEKNPPSHAMRYLTVAAWFKLHRQIDAVTADHVYTCYRHVRWPTDVPDWGQPLRDLKRQQYLGGETRGQYEINQLGLQQVENLPKT
jgi:hypothetical protein